MIELRLIASDSARQGQLAALVSTAPRQTPADYHLESPAQVRAWSGDQILELEERAG